MSVIQSRGEITGYRNTRTANLRWRLLRAVLFFTTTEPRRFSIFRLITRGTNPAWRGSRVVQVDVKGWSCLFLGNVYRKLLGWTRRKSRIPNNEKTTILCREGANSRTIWRTIFAIFFSLVYCGEVRAFLSKSGTEEWLPNYTNARWMKIEQLDRRKVLCTAKYSLYFNIHIL